MELTIFVPAGSVILLLVLLHIKQIFLILFYLIVPSKTRLKCRLWCIRSEHKSEGFHHIAQKEVGKVVHFIHCLNAWTQKQFRPVIIVDKLESCDQGTLLQILDMLSTLLLEPGRPFIVLVAIDPDTVQSAVSKAKKSLFEKCNITGQDYLRSMIHLPFYIESADSKKLGRARRTCEKVGEAGGSVASLYGFSPCSCSRKHPNTRRGGACMEGR